MPKRKASAAAAPEVAVAITMMPEAAPTAEVEFDTRNLRTVSYSKLTKYDECSQYYKLANIDRVLDHGDTDWTRLGGFCHEVLEVYYAQPELVRTPFEILAGKGGVWMKEFEKYGLQSLIEPLAVYNKHMRILNDRISPNYKGADAIRTKDGRVPDKPQMTSGWKDYVKQHGLDAMAANIDRTAAQLAPKRWGGGLSLSLVFTESTKINRGYRHDPRIHAVVGIELEISEMQYAAADEDGNILRDAEGNYVPTSRMRGDLALWADPSKGGKPLALGMGTYFLLPKLDANGKMIPKGNDFERREDKAFMAYIDLLARDAKGRLLIIDHKTNKLLPDVDHVERHEQLLVYGLMIELLTGEAPYQIGINHLRSSTLVLGRYRRAAAVEALERLLQTYSGIEKEVFLRHHPDAFGNPCVKSFGGKTTLCPGLQLCHPAVYASYQAAS